MEGCEQYRNQQQNQQATQTVEQWQPPVRNRLKCNVDANFFNNVGATGWGWCIRDYRGRFILASSNIIHQRLNTFEGEAMAIKE
ncbi:polynucleotidyl transferase ribonuclease H fold, partial [Trifolium medium]|nr:polynucleotidyl transferase ribonuclease H fold [Trifolium medium]